MDMPPDLLLYVVVTISSIVLAASSVLLARGHISTPSALVRQIDSGSTSAKTATVRHRPWRVAIDARPMIGEPTKGGHEYQAFGMGRYLHNLVLEIAKQDTDTEYVLWSTALKYRTPPWYEDFVRSHPNIRAVHARIPNLAVDAASVLRGFRSLSELVGHVHVSYEVNFFQIRPRGAYSICSVPNLSRPDLRIRRRYRAFQMLASWQAARADKITTGSHASKRILLRELAGVTEDRIAVVYGAAEKMFNHVLAKREFERVRAKYGLPEVYFTYPGEPVAKTHLPSVIRGFQRVRLASPSSCLLVVGIDSDELKSQLRAFHQHTDVTNVRAIGHVPTLDLPSLHYGAVALVYPSNEDGDAFSLPLLEAMSTGQLIVTSDIDATREIAQDVAIFENLSNEQHVASGLLRVLEMSDTERQDRIAAGLRRSHQFSWTASADIMLKLFELGFRNSAKHP